MNQTNPIRPMDTKKDMERVKDIYRNAMPPAHPCIPKQFWENNLPNFIEETEKRADEKYVYVDYEEGEEKIKGFITLGYINDLPYIFELAVLPSEQNKGIGKELINRAKEFVNEQKILKTHVYVVNFNAINFYIRNDFEIKGIHQQDITECRLFLKYTMKWLKSSKSGKV